MSEFYLYLIAFVAGAGIGLFYFGGLWLTIQQLPKVRHPALLLAASFLGRTGLSLFGFYLLANGRGENLLSGILGFLLMRFVLTRHQQAQPAGETQKWI
ncbi:MAG TPA: ATP synthase subunit I [Anaerolineae bacterium]|jgi:F1F0 ATPase subunit 2